MPSQIALLAVLSLSLGIFSCKKDPEPDAAKNPDPVAIEISGAGA